ncbi:protein FAR1-RELATED SEQUENCE 5-like [Camellia sinensis]|uniref:protein FAR1-RELATED SEQUENCE 5-like n=1 Tax=Camellia sinensis TaxID=4442 RepID=UPI0010360557|nr:protein FAR1-RELATED SEQUENCE 5-like [Camellia sinensis]
MAIRNVGVKTSQIMNYMVNQSGSYENVGFIRTNLHNHIQAERRAEVEDGDAQGALVYLCAKLDVDPDSKLRADYAKFGDVLIFDSTYRTNAYKKPFVMLAEKGKLNVNDVFLLPDGQKCYYIHKYKVKDRSWIVTHNPVDAAMRCSCMKFESLGLPCCHMICVMKAENLTQIPPTCVLYRWTKAASKDSQQWR